MPLQMTFTESASTLSISNAYWKVLRAEFDLENNILVATVAAFISKAAADAGKAPIPSSTMVFAIGDPDFTTYFAPAVVKAANGNLKTCLYNAIKAQATFTSGSIVA